MSDPLAAVARGEADAVPTPILITDEPLVRLVQARLTHHGLLDPSPDGYWGPVSTWALSEFCRAAGMAFPDSVDQPVATALLGADPVLPLHPGDDLPGRVVRAILRRGGWVCRHPDCVTIAYVEGLSEAGNPVARRPDAFDDLRLLLRYEPGGHIVLAGAWQATAAAGRPAVEQPAEAAGAPRLAPGQYKAWVMGRTAIGTELEQEALVQASDLPVTRDAGRDFQRQGDERQVGRFVIDQHSGMDAPPDAVGGVGAGCLVGRETAGHAAFMTLLRGDARWRANNAYRFMTALLTAKELGQARL